ncbi:hypothetical protein [Streptomyces sp. NPDC050255]|uniref:hypothetical protein n=1 Tax=Streptomyces sp. NPDC050255 TaxID=3365606 RepID=UPI0037B92330
MDAVTAVESHVDHALQSLIARSELPSSGIGSAFLARYSDDMTRTWDARYEWLSEGFGVKVKGKKFQQDFNVAVECRNAIVHGSGHLTKRQQSNLVKFVELRKQLQSILKIAAHGTEMIFSADSARNAVTVTSEFVHGFDEILLGATAMDY